MSNAPAVIGFSSKTTQPSNGGKATCQTGLISVQLHAQNVKLNYDGSANQSILTQTFVDLLTADSNHGASIVGDPSPVQGTFQINANLCFPVNCDPSKIDTVQLLTHGGSLNSLYWDLPENSFIDAAAAAGYATFAYDRLGAGQSDHPDPVQIVQASVQIELSHVLTQALRDGSIDGKTKFKSVIATSHSSGNVLTIGQTLKYPGDFDALVITGFSTNSTFMHTSLAAGAYQPAAASGIQRFQNLPNGYYVQATPQSIQFLFFAFPDYNQEIMDLLVTNKDTQTIGELFTLGTALHKQSDFKGPIDVVNGEKDFIFCGANGAVASEESAKVKQMLFPSAASTSETFIVPGSGHNINAHKSALGAYDQIFGFLEKNGFASAVKKV